MERDPVPSRDGTGMAFHSRDWDILVIPEIFPGQMFIPVPGREWVIPVPVFRDVKKQKESCLKDTKKPKVLKKNWKTIEKIIIPSI